VVDRLVVVPLLLPLLNLNLLLVLLVVLLRQKHIRH
jgi:hypothetical protein